ncbi:hypothetical protein BH10BAC5_BH10BAC5_02400 [soil metagenome]
MRKLLFAFILFILSQECSAQSGWSQVYSLPQSGYYQCMEFANSSTGFIGSDTCMYRTTNGGYNWVRISDHPFQSIQFVNSQTGFAVFYFSGSYGNNLLKTTDCGMNWFYPGNSQLRNLYMVDTLIGYTKIVSSDNLSHTTNGGISWLITNNNFHNDEQLFYVTNSVGLTINYYYVGQAGYMNMDRTENGGFSWHSVYSSQNIRVNSKFYKLKINEGPSPGYTVYAGSSSGHYLKSTDSGLTWAIMNTGFGSNYYFSMYFKDQNTGFACGGTGTNGCIIKTTNAGLDWTYSMNYSGGMVKDILFTDSLTGYALTTTGKIFKTTNGGLTGLSSNLMIPSRFGLSQNYPNPFNPTTKINYELPSSNFVSLKVYDALGNEVETLVNENQNAGSYPVTFNATNYPSGIYFYKLVTNNYSETRKMILLK